MPRNGSGVYSLPALNPVVAATVIDPAWANNTLNDLVTQLNNVLTRDNLLAPILPLLAVDGTIGVPGLTFAAEQSTGFYRASSGNVRLSILGSDRAIFTAAGLAMPVVVAAGTVDAITGAFSPALTVLSANPVWFRASGANTSTTPTFKRDGLLAKTIVKANNQPLVAGDIPGVGAWMALVYDATLDKEVLLNPPAPPAPVVSATRTDVASVAGTVDLTVAVPTNPDIRITGALAITAFTVVAGRVLRVTASAAHTLTNNANIVTQTGGNIICAAGDTYMLRATAANTVEVLNFTKAGAGTASGRLLGVTVYTAGNTYAKATNNPTFILVQVIGGGGGGGGTSAVGACGGGGGGGGGGTKRILNASLGASETITIGAAGAAGTSGGGNGGTGGTTSFGALVTATGGSGGSGSTSGVPGSAGGGGTSTGADIFTYGNPGTLGSSGGTGSTSGAGGGSVNGGGGTPLGTTAATGSTGASASGGGGGGGLGLFTTAVAGGAGASGICIIWEYN